VLVGHSLGAYAAAAVADVFSLPDAMRLVVERGRLLRTVAGGAMVAVPLPENEVAPLLTDDLDVAVVNGPAQCVIAGPPDAVDRLMDRLATDGVDARRLRIPVPAHSRYVEPIAARFEQHVAALALRPPRIPLLSEITGKQLTADEVTSPAYWRWHLRHTVRFVAALETLFTDANRVIVEVGPGQALTGIVRRHPHRPAEVTAVPTMMHPEEDGSDLAALLMAVGQLWAAGADVDWPMLHRSQPGRRRVPLPTYPFQRRRYAVEPPSYEGFTPSAPTGPFSSSEPAPPSPVATSVAPADAPDVAARVAAVFCQVLGVSQVRSNDSLFSLGGDSVIAAQMVRLLRQTFEIPLPLRTVFRNPTVAGLARQIEEQLAAPPVTEDTA